MLAEGRRSSVDAKWSERALPVQIALVLVSLVALPAWAHAQTPAEGLRAVAKYGCENCHELPARQVQREASCVGCHQRIQSRSSMLSSGPRLTHYLDTPDIRRVAHRLKSEYLVRFIRDPHDVRPRLEESMPRLPVGEHDARAIVAYLQSLAPPPNVPRSPPADLARVERGRNVFGTGGCAACHAFGNHDAGYALPAPALRALGTKASFAPNLRHLRDRMTPDVALAWIRDPASIDPNAHMDRPDLTEEDALAVRDFLLLADPGPAVRPRRPLTFDALSAQSQAVAYADVRAILSRSCIHCHAHTTNSSTVTAFGFQGAALDLGTYEGIHAGTRLPDGSRRSILAPDESGVPPLVARLLRRHSEARRDVVEVGRDPLDPAVRARIPTESVGMPLGLPPVGSSDIALIGDWITQGAPP